MGASKQKKPGGAAAIAAGIVAGTAEPALDHYARSLSNDKPSAATRAARVFDEVAALKPALLVPYIERLVALLQSDQKRVVRTSAKVLPLLVETAPAKVARHLERLVESYPSVSDVGKDGLVRTYAALCATSIAYQKRLIDVIVRALGEVEAPKLEAWARLVLPVLKGEPHAEARAVVERRVEEIPRPEARKVAEFLGVKLRPPRR
jgi:hypothetical protein